MNSILKYLQNIPSGTLRKLIGQDICDAIVNYNIFNHNLEVQYEKLLINKYGKRLLFSRPVFRELIIYLEDDLIQMIASEIAIKYQSIAEARHIICHKNFGYQNVKFSLAVLQVLLLDQDSFLPPQEELEEKYSSYIIPDFQLHPYQKLIKDKAVQYLLNPEHSDKLLIHMPTGAGKTKTAMETITDFLRNKSILGGYDKSVFIIWLAHTKELCDQAVDSFNKTWSLRGDHTVDVFRIYGNYIYPSEILESKRAFVCIGFQKFNALTKSAKPENIAILKAIKNQVDLVIVDEAHKSLAATYGQTINSFSKGSVGVQLVGLTATPGRSTEQQETENDHLVQFFNCTKLTLMDEYEVPLKNPVKYLQDAGVLAKLDRIELFTEVDIQLSDKQVKDLRLFGDDKLKKILEDLSIHPGRNKLIIDKIKECSEKDESILIFACNIQHCIILQTLLFGEGIESATVLSSTSTKDRETSIERFKSRELKVLINYGVLTTGFDAPNLNTLIIARPTSSIVLYSQMIGRALRGKENGGHETNKLIDLRDNFQMGSESIMFNYFDEIWLK